MLQNIKKNLSAISPFTVRDEAGQSSNRKFSEGSAAARQVMACRVVWYIYGSVFVLGESFCMIPRSIPPALQILRQLHIELPHIEAPDVLPVQIHHIAVGDAPLPLGLQEGEPLPPLG